MQNEESGLEKFTEVIETVITGIPAPIRKNFFKAFGQLCTAAIDVPVTWLEGKAAELKATSDARIKIIQKEGDQFSNAIKIPAAYIEKASEKFASKIIREQLNLDDITLRAAKELSMQHDNIVKNEPASISEEWLNKFESHARIKSSEEMKIIFSKILSGEIKQPGSFSMKTLDLISQLDNKAATLFQNLCNLTSGMYLGEYLFDAQVVSFNGSAASNSLEDFELGFANLNILEEYGLINSDYNSWIHYAPSIANDQNKVRTSIKLGNKYFGFKTINNLEYDKILQTSGVRLTNAGKELYQIIPKGDNQKYFDAYTNILKVKALR